ncbi:MAG: hypothetical protein Q8K37_04360, partial [Alphaproteobacteria bacterium]|nr:hypothetical protein [Alphaproteobacteria bacterium]
MSVAIAELTVSMNQDTFHPKIESQQNSLFEDAMREIYVQGEISSQKEILAAQKSKQNVPNPLVDSVIDPTEDQTILVGNSKDSKVAATYIEIEQQYVSTQDLPDYLENELNLLVINQQNKQSGEHTRDIARTLVIEQEDVPNVLESPVISIAPERQHINIKEASLDVGNSINTIAIIKNTSFPIEIHKDFRNLYGDNDDKMSAFYPNANYIIHEKSNVDLEANDVTISNLKTLDQSLFQLNDAELLLQNIKFQDSKLPINVENEKLLEESPQAETLKLLNHQNTHQQSVQNRESPVKIDVFPTPTILSTP